MNKTIKGFLLGVVLTSVAGTTAIVGASPKKFTDVEGKWYEKQAKRAEIAKIVNGYPDGTFQGNKPVTRAELVAILDNMAKQGYITIPSTEKEYTNYQLFYNEVGKVLEQNIYSGKFWVE